MKNFKRVIQLSIKLPKNLKLSFEQTTLEFQISESTKQNGAKTHL